MADSKKTDEKQTDDLIREALYDGHVLLVKFRSAEAELSEAQNARNQAIEKAKKDYDEAIRKADLALKTKQDAVESARAALEEHQQRVRNEHGIVLDLLQAQATGGGRTRL